MIKIYKGHDRTKNDKALSRVQGDAFIVMIICLLIYFPCRDFMPFLAKYIVWIFILAAFIGFGIGFIWLKKDYQEFKKAYLQKLQANHNSNNKKKDKS